MAAVCGGLNLGDQCFDSRFRYDPYLKISVNLWLSHCFADFSGIGDFGQHDAFNKWFGVSKCVFKSIYLYVSLR